MASDDSPFKTIATAIIAVFNAEFADEGYIMISDDIHESLGRDAVAVGIAPVEDRANPRNRLVEETWVEVKFFDLWTDEIDPGTMVDPARITGYAQRLKNALRRARVSSTSDVWYFDVDRTQYPRDPTGNKTRFVMTIRAFGENRNLVETVA